MKRLSIPFPSSESLAALNLRQCLALGCAREPKDCASSERDEGYKVVSGGRRRSPRPYTGGRDGFRLFPSPHPSLARPFRHPSPKDRNPGLHF